MATMKSVYQDLNQDEALEGILICLNKDQIEERTHGEAQGRRVSAIVEETRLAVEKLHRVRA